MVGGTSIAGNVNCVTSFRRCEQRVGRIDIMTVSQWSTCWIANNLNLAEYRQDTIVYISIHSSALMCCIRLSCVFCIHMKSSFPGT